MTKLEDSLKMAKIEIDELNKEKKQLKAHNARKHTGYEAEYEEVLIEKQRMANEIVKLQTEKDILLAKVTTLEKKAEEHSVVDECIKDAMCEGNCERVGCSMAQLQKLSVMKKQGGGRNSPVEEASTFRCPQCNYKSGRESELQHHMKNKHAVLPSCPFCLVGFCNQNILRKHIEEQHSENTQVVREWTYSDLEWRQQ